MSNMSHCRFHNTSLDLQDCIDDIDERLNNKGLCEEGEKLSHSEKSMMYEMIEQAKYYAERAEEFAEFLEDNEMGQYDD